MRATPFIAGVILAAAFFSLPGARAQGNATGAQAEEEKQACIKNLKVIYEAIQAYQVEHKDIPNWLSDLVPQYLEDPNVLVCPVCRRTGKTEAAPLADPRISSSYLFEFCPVPLGNTAPNAPTRSRREWKRRQMGLVGSVVPVVRCRHHPGISINLAFDGRVYEAPGMWELAFTNRIPADALTAAKLFAEETAPSPAPKNSSPPRWPSRDAKAGPELLDLTKYYNVQLSSSWLGPSNANLSSLPKGLQTFGDTQFDVRGIVQLAGKSLTDKKYHTQVTSIPVNQKCKHLNFLHATALAAPADEGVQVASYFVHFAGNSARLEIPIQYGRDIRDWHPVSGERWDNGPSIAWSHDASPGGVETRLFKTTWTNLLPDIPIESIDLVSTGNGAAPFVVAITAD